MSPEYIKLPKYDVIDAAGSLFGSGPFRRADCALETELKRHPFFVLAKVVSIRVNEIHELWRDLQDVVPKSPTPERLVFLPDLSLSESLALMIDLADFGDEQVVRAKMINTLSTHHNAMKTQSRRLKYEILITRIVSFE
jgi:hypothetical protein